MLARQGIISEADGKALVDGLQRVRGEIDSDTFPWREELEDLHMNIEQRLHELVGDAAGRLHTARSRNDQVATCLRLFTREAIARAAAGLRKLQGALLDLAEVHANVLMPGYTHTCSGPSQSC